jgi:hypothetical protein
MRKKYRELKARERGVPIEKIRIQRKSSVKHNRKRNK